MAWLGKPDEAGRLGVQQAVDVARKSIEPGSETEHMQPLGRQLRFEFDDDQSAVQPRWVEVNAGGVRVEHLRQFGGPWLALHLIQTLQLDTFLDKVIPEGREHVPWDVSSLILIIARLLEPSSELFIAEQWYPKTSLPDLLGVPEERIDDNRLYRALDQLLPHNEALEVHLENRLGELFQLEYDLLLYDVTSTYFEGAADFPLAQRGYSRAPGATCSGQTSPTGPTKNSGKPTFNSRKRKPPFESIRATCRFTRSGIRKRSVCWLTSSCASLPTCCGKHWGSCVTKQDWAANLAECFQNSLTSVPWTSCCPLAPARRSEPGAFPSRLITNKSCWKNSASNCPRK